MPGSPDSSAVVALRPRRVVTVMAAIVGLLVCGHLVAMYVYRGVGQDAFPGASVVARLLNMDGETNLPTWYATTALSFCAVLAALVAVGVWNTGDERSRWRWHWLGLAAVLAFLSLDDFALLHEELSRPLTRSFELEPERWEFWAWLAPYTLAGLVFLAVFARFLVALPARTRTAMLLAGAVFVAGAAGMELVGRELFNPFDPDATYLAAVGVEELLEKVGVIILAWALLTHLRDHVGSVTLSWSAEPGTATTAPGASPDQALSRRARPPGPRS